MGEGDSANALCLISVGKYFYRLSIGKDITIAVCLARILQLICWARFLVCLGNYSEVCRFGKSPSLYGEHFEVCWFCKFSHFLGRNPEAPGFGKQEHRIYTAVVPVALRLC